MTPPSARVVSPLTIAASVLAEATWLLLLWAWVFPHLPHTAFDVLVVSLAGLGIQLAIVVGLGGLRPADLGLTTGLVRGVVWSLGAWAVAQLVLVAYALATGSPLALAHHDPAQLPNQLGNAVAEEIVFRGFLLVQLARLLRGRRGAWVLALFTSQLWFAISHIPQRWIIMDLHGDLLVGNLAWTALFGVFFALAYLRTGLLAIAIGLHVLTNAGFELIATPLDATSVNAWVFVVVLAAWPYLGRVRDTPQRC